MVRGQINRMWKHARRRMLIGLPALIVAMPSPVLADGAPCFFTGVLADSVITEFESEFGDFGFTLPASNPKLDADIRFSFEHARDLRLHPSTACLTSTPNSTPGIVFLRGPPRASL